MKSIFLIIIITFTLFSCNKEIELNINPEEEKIPDYNLLSESLPITFDLKDEIYATSPSIYLRPYENVSHLDQVVIGFSSNKNARYIIAGDTLYNGDKKKMKYADFNNYLLKFKYQSELTGEHQISIETTIRSISKKTTLNLSTPQ